MNIGISPELSERVDALAASTRRVQTALSGGRTTSAALDIAEDFIVAGREEARRIQIMIRSKRAELKAEARAKERREFA